MTEHLPECWIVSHSNPLNGCICTELRACEQRIGNVISASLVGGYDWRHGYLAGLDAAREAVAALDPQCIGLCECLSDTLAAIDALKINTSPQQ